jgi:hypothetical protein
VAVDFEQSVEHDRRGLAESTDLKDARFIKAISERFQSASVGGRHEGVLSKAAVDVEAGELSVQACVRAAAAAGSTTATCTECLNSHRIAHS